MFAKTANADACKKMKKDSLISKYFNDTFSAEEKKKFDNLLKTDEDFKAEFEFEKDVKASVISIKKDQLKETLENAENRKPGKNRLTYFWAASVVIALGLFSLFIFNNQEVNRNELYAQYFEPYPNIIAPATRSNDSIANLRHADFIAYENGNYITASQIFEQRYTKTKSPHFLFYQGVCELQLGNTQKAIELFERNKTEADLFKNYSNWYLALAHLKEGNIQMSEKLLQQISDARSYKYKSADAILKKIK